MEDGYEAAVKILKDRFDHRDQLMVGHVDALLTTTPVKTSADVERLRSLHDEIRLNSLEGLGVAPDRPLGPAKGVATRHCSLPATHERISSK